MILREIAIRSLSALLLLGLTAAQQNSAASQKQMLRQSSASGTGDASCTPQTPTAAAPFDTCKYLRLGPGIRPPKAMKAPIPDYPERARRDKLTGSVVIAVAISAQGNVEDAKVVRSSNPVFERNAIDTVRQWKFEPASQDGKPVAVQLQTEMTFNLH